MESARALFPWWALGLLVMPVWGCADDGGGSERQQEAPDAESPDVEAPDVEAPDVDEPDVAEDEPTPDADEPDADEPDVDEPPCEVVWAASDGFSIFAYEASRLDATAGGEGADASAACSRPGVMPWTTIDRLQAAEACASVGATLCTGAQWDQACRGPNRSVLPYGADFDPEACNTVEGPDGCITGNCQVVPTGSYPRCESASGAFDMSGNVAEWVEDQRPFGDEAYDVRGGSFLSANDNTIRCRNANLSRPPDFTNPDLGFRCCRSN